MACTGFPVKYGKRIKREEGKEQGINNILDYQLESEEGGNGMGQDGKV